VTGLSNDDLDKIAQALRPARDFSGVWESFTRILTTLIAAGTLWLLQSTSDLKAQLAVMKSEQTGMSETIKELKQNANLPRFTEESFRNSIAPLEQNIRRSEGDITALKAGINSLERSILKLEKNSEAQ
jgi:hypothetical protein